MFSELSAAFAALPVTAQRAHYAHAIIDENCLQKPTAASRKITNQRLGELYTLDLAVPMFRVLRRLWEIDRADHPLLALLIALARDQFLRVTAAVVVHLSPGTELPRDRMRSALFLAAGDRLKEAVIDKIMRNTASSWTQSGHLVGRTFKVRRLVRPTSPAVALAVYLAYKSGFRGPEIFTSGWTRVLDGDVTAVRTLALEAKRLGLIDLRMAGDIVEINVDRLESPLARVAYGSR